MRVCSSNYLCAKVIRHDLNSIADQQARPSDVVEDVVKEDHNNNSICRLFRAMYFELCRADRPNHKYHEHTTCGDQEQQSPPQSVNEETHARGNDDIREL